MESISQISNQILTQTSSIKEQEEQNKNVSIFNDDGNGILDENDLKNYIKNNNVFNAAKAFLKNLLGANFEKVRDAVINVVKNLTDRFNKGEIIDKEQLNAKEQLEIAGFEATEDNTYIRKDANGKTWEVTINEEDEINLLRYKQDSESSPENIAAQKPELTIVNSYQDESTYSTDVNIEQECTYKDANGNICEATVFILENESGKYTKITYFDNEGVAIAQSEITEENVKPDKNYVIDSGSGLAYSYPSGTVLIDEKHYDGAGGGGTGVAQHNRYIKE